MQRRERAVPSRLVAQGHGRLRLEEDVGFVLHADEKPCAKGGIAELYGDAFHVCRHKEGKSGTREIKKVPVMAR